MVSQDFAESRLDSRCEDSDPRSMGRVFRVAAESKPQARRQGARTPIPKA